MKQYPSAIFASLTELKVKELAPPQVARRTPAATAAPTPSPPKKPYPPNARPWLGVQIQQVTNESAKSIGMPAARGTFIVKALAGSPADKGDMKAGDVILNVGKTNIVQFRDVPKAIASHSPGEKVLIGRWRKSDRGIRYRDSYAKYARSQKTFPPNEPILDGLGFAIIHSVKGVEIVKVKPNLQAAQKISRRAISSLKSINMPSIRLGNSMIELLKPRKRKQKNTHFFAEKR